LATALALAAVAALPAGAQTSPDARALYAGTWTGTLTSYETSYSRAGKTTWHSTCTWHGGTQYLVCDRHYSDGQTTGDQLTIYTRSPDGSYHFTRLDDRGGAHGMEVTVDANTWTYNTQFSAGGVPVLLRVENAFPNGSQYSERIEYSADGGHRWINMSDGSETKVSGP
jgi:hypothetical protein